MEAVLISIQPKWVEKIISGKKTIEVRKTAPKIETPFKCYIYCTQGANFNHKENKDIKQLCNRLAIEQSQGKVIGEFICDEIKEIKADNAIQAYFNNTHETCLTDTELRLYATKGKPLYGLHISNLKIYDKPKEISEFYQPCSQSKNLNCDWLRKHNICACSNKRFLTRPPQSWCYVETL